MISKTLKNKHKLKNQNVTNHVKKPIKVSQETPQPTIQNENVHKALTLFGAFLKEKDKNERPSTSNNPFRRGDIF